MYDGKVYKYGNCDTEILDYNHNHDDENHLGIEEDGEHGDRNSEDEDYTYCICGHKNKKTERVLLDNLTKEVNRQAAEQGNRGE